jgi:hypothetical protein
LKKKRKEGRKMKKVIRVLSLAVVLGIGFSGTGIAKAEVVQSTEEAQQNTLEYTQEDYELIKQKQIEMGVTPEKAEELIAKLKNGEVLDADVLSPEEAVSKVEKVDGDTTTITYTFADGSVAQSKFPSNLSTINSMSKSTKGTKGTKGTISPNSISGGSCTTTSVTTVCTNRKVSYQGATYGYSFYADYTIVRYDYDSIQWAGNWNIWCAGGNYTNPSMRIIRSKETSSAKAEARLSATINLGGGGGSLTRSLSLHVGGDSASDSWNSYY